jgi:GGDEF domain-containing protein
LSPRRPRFLRLLLLLLAVLPAWCAAATLQLTVHGPARSLADGAEFRVDPTGQASAPAVLAESGGWQPLPDDEVFGARWPAVTWVRFSVQVGAGNEADWFLELPHATLMRAEVYRVGPEARIGVPQASGVLTPISQWPVRASLPVFQLHADAQRATTYLLRLEHPATLGGAPLIRSPRDLLESQGTAQLFIGAYFGLALLALLYVVVQALVHRDGALGWCSAYLVAMILTLACLSGQVHQTLVGEEPALSAALLMLSPVLLGAVGLAFLRSAVPQAVIGPLERALVWLCIVLAALLAAAYPFLDLAERWFLTRSFGALSMLVGGGLLVRSLRWQLPHVRWLAAGQIVLGAGAALPLLKGFGVVASGLFSQYGLLFASAIDLPLLLYAMSLLRRDHDVVSARLREAAQYDLVTGLLRPKELLPRLAQMKFRSQRHAIRSAVVMFEVVNLRDIRLRQGASIAEQALLMAGRQVQQGMRASDVVVRFNEQRVVALLDGVANPGEVLMTVHRIIHQAQHYTGELPGAETLQLHAVVAHLPEDRRDTPQALVDALVSHLGRMRPGSGARLRQLTTLAPQRQRPRWWRKWLKTRPWEAGAE